MSAERQTYLDASALVKLVVFEAESEPLRAHLVAQPYRASCALAHVEVIRAVRPEGPEAVELARDVLQDISILALDEPLLRSAADHLQDEELRSLDAIHIAAAASLGTELAELISYDRRMLKAAEAVGLPVSAPA